MDTILCSMHLNDTMKNLASIPERSPAFADMDVGVRATQRSCVPEQFAEFARFPLMFVRFMQYAG